MKRFVSVPGLLLLMLAPLLAGAGEPAGGIVREVRIATADPKVVLAGTLLTPATGVGGTAVLLITGSGGHRRDQIISGAPMFRWIAEDLAAAGVATLRLDDRGVDASTGPKVSQSTTADRVEDMRAALDWLRGRDAGHFASVGVLGHSEGAAIAAKLAARDDSLAFAVLLGAPALKGSDVWVGQNMEMLRTRGGVKDAEVLGKVERNLREVVALSISGAPPDAMRSNGVALFAVNNVDVTKAENAKMLDGFVGRMSEPWMRYFLADDPAAALAQMRLPVLALYGSDDHLTSPSQNAAPLVTAMLAAGNHDFSLRVLPEQDHFFLRAPGKPVGEHVFGKMEIDPALLREIRSWILLQRHD